MRIYLTARWARRDEMKQHRETIIAAGHRVTSRWIDEKDGADPEFAAIVDLDDLRASDCVIVFTEEPDVGYTTGGRHVETGFALALSKPICVIGPRENVFLHLKKILFANNVTEAIETLRQQF